MTTKTNDTLAYDKRNIEILQDLAFDIKCIHTALRSIAKYTVESGVFDFSLNSDIMFGAIGQLRELSDSILGAARTYEGSLSESIEDYQFTARYLDDYSYTDVQSIAKLKEVGLVQTEKGYAKLCKTLEEMIGEAQSKRLFPTDSYDQKSSLKDAELARLNTNISARLEDIINKANIASYFVPKNKKSLEYNWR